MNAIRQNKSLSALAEIALLFSPALPAYLWIWPNIKSPLIFEIVQSMVYVYFLAGCLYIGLRRWRLSELGVRREGFWFSFFYGGIFLLALWVGLRSTNLIFNPASLSVKKVVWHIFFYVILVGWVEELLFRGLLYQTLKILNGETLAIFGSTLAFGLYHIGWASPVTMLGIAFLGIFFAMIRWRSGNIMGLALIHGLIDILAKEFYPKPTPEHIKNVAVVNSYLAIVGDILLFGLAIYLWKFHPMVMRKINRYKGN